MPSQPDRGGIADLATLLDIEPLELDLFRGHNADHGYERPTLYGGQVAAQALRAAGLTVPPERVPHSLHGYFLRPGTPRRPILLRVARDRDGRSFSARHVAAVQDGEVLFSMLASFHGATGGVDYEQLEPITAPAPEDTPPRIWDGLLEMREVTPTRLEEGRFTDRVWVRAAAPLPDDHLVQACGLVYLSDVGSGFGQVEHPGLSTSGPSIDHALWFHEPIRPDEWVLVDLAPWKARNNRGLYSGVMRDRDGRLGASLGQEMLLRWHKFP